MQVNISQVSFPAPGRKFGKLQLNDGQTLWVPPELLGQFRGGMTAEVGTKQQTWGQGADARQVTIVTTGPTGPMQGGTLPLQAAPYGQNYGQAATQQASQQPNTGFQPRVYEGGRGQQQSAEVTRMNFIMGITGRALGSGKFATSEIAVLAQEASRAYDLVTTPSPKPQPQRSDEPPPYPDGEPVA